MDEFTHIINGMDIEGVLNGGDLPVVVDGRFTGEIHAEKVTLGEYGLVCWKAVCHTCGNRWAVQWGTGLRHIECRCNGKN